jgi:hypothetical protein
VSEARRPGPLAALSVLGAGAGWGALTGAAAGALVVFLGADEPGAADVPGAVALGLLFGAPTGALLGLGLSLLPAGAVAFAPSPGWAQWAAVAAYAPVAVLLVAAQFTDGVEGQEPYAAVLVTAALFGLWRCRRSAAVAVERVASRRAAPPVARPGVPLEEPSL